MLLVGVSSGGVLEGFLNSRATYDANLVICVTRNHGRWLCAGAWGRVARVLPEIWAGLGLACVTLAHVSFEYVGLRLVCLTAPSAVRCA